MPKKTIRCNFFNIDEPTYLDGKINELLYTRKRVVDSGKVDNVDVSGVVLRFTYLKENQHNNNNYWVGIIEKLDVTEQGEAANMDGVRELYATGADEGPIVNTGFTYYPLTKTFTLHQKKSGVNDYKLGVFLRKLIKQTNVVSSGSNKFQLNLVPDIYKLERLSKAPKVKELIYSFALPKNIDAINDNNRKIMGDHQLLSILNGERIYIQINAESMDRNQTLNKIKDIFKHSPSTLKAKTEHNDIEDSLDLLTEKFTDKRDLNLKKGAKETPTLVMDTVEEIFLGQKTLITNMYLN